jgi:hypothetical protein
MIPAELLDRPLAEMLRDEIDLRGSVSRGRRAVIISDLLLRSNRIEQFSDYDLQDHPLIALGGPRSNFLTDELAKQGSRREMAQGLWVSGQFPKMAVWESQLGHKLCRAARSITPNIANRTSLPIVWAQQ